MPKTTWKNGPPATEAFLILIFPIKILKNWEDSFVFRRSAAVESLLIVGPASLPDILI
jgi:hypothetical protein